MSHNVGGCPNFHFIPKNNQVVPKDFGDRSRTQIANADRGKSRQIAANRGKFHSENNGDHFFKKSQRPVQKSMAITLEVKFKLFLPFLLTRGNFFS